MLMYSTPLHNFYSLSFSSLQHPDNSVVSSLQIRSIIICESLLKDFNFMTFFEMTEDAHLEIKTSQIRLGIESPNSF